MNVERRLGMSKSKILSRIKKLSNPPELLECSRFGHKYMRITGKDYLKLLKRLRIINQLCTGKYWERQIRLYEEELEDE